MMIPKTTRIYHPYWDWECFHAGLFSSKMPDGLTPEQCKQKYAEFLEDLFGFYVSMVEVSKKWPKSCEHFLTNENINRIAWLGQAAMCIHTGIPRAFRAGFCLLQKQAADAANKTAADFLVQWITHENNKNEEKNIGICGGVDQMRLF